MAEFVLPWFYMTGYLLCFYGNIYEMKPDIFEIFRTLSRYLEKKYQEFPQTYLSDFSWYLYLGLKQAMLKGLSFSP